MGKGKAPEPLTEPALEALALAYLERFQTTRARLVRYLAAKLRAVGWESEVPPDLPALVERLAARGYLDEEAFAEARARGMARKGFGSRRIAARLMADGIAPEPAIAHAGTADEDEQARAFARRRRFGPWGVAPLDRATWRRQFAAMLRAGHAPDVARRVLATLVPDGDQPEAE